MKLSVLIPMYNSEKYIGNCLDSLLNQDLLEDDYEIIVMDDGSSDNSASIVETYTEKHKNIFLHLEKNSGTYATRNKLLKLAKGDYVFNLDNDDYIVHNCLGTLLKYTAKNNLDVIGFNSISTSDMGLVHLKLDSSLNENLPKVYDGIHFLKDFKSRHIMVWWYFVRREFLIENNIVFVENNPLEDGPFTFNVFLHAKRVMHLPLDIHRYVKAPDSIMKNQSEAHIASMIDSYLDIIRRYEFLSKKASQIKDSRIDKVMKTAKYWGDLNTYVLIRKLIKLKTSKHQIKYLITELEHTNAYPLSNFIGREFSSLKHKLIVFVFNHKGLLFIAMPLAKFLNELRPIE
ncbi:glycosyltransferase [Algibacter sp. 2305UL17-15]|uniref:glycosyltransferase family 2 protein n=1 Tax=Algibacter sp. 2305UL17-15 TaxID=3231268 RepID=UPI0034587A10